MVPLQLVPLCVEWQRVCTIQRRGTRRPYGLGITSFAHCHIPPRNPGSRFLATCGRAVCYELYAAVYQLRVFKLCLLLVWGPGIFAASLPEWLRGWT